MSNLTPEELAILDGISKNHNSKNAEVYYNYNYNNKSGSCSSSSSYSTVQQSTEPSAPAGETVTAPEAHLFSSSPSGPDEKKSKEVRKNIPRKISREHYYVQINISINEVSRGKRTTRMTAYMSLKEDNDKKFTIFLRSSLTSAVHETVRLLKEHENTFLMDKLIQMQMNCPKEAKFLCGRIRYNPRQWKLEAEHKPNLSSAIIGIYDYKTHLECILFLFDEPYVFSLTDDLTEKQQSKFEFTGSWVRDLGETE